MKKHIRLIACIIAILMLMPIFAACNNSGGDSGAGANDSEGTISALPAIDFYNGEPAKILFLPPLLMTPERLDQFEYLKYLTRFWPSIQWEAWESNVDATTQATLFQEGIQQGFDIIYICPLDAPAMTQLVRQAEDQGVRVISFSTEIETKHTLHLANDKYGEGWNCAEAIDQYYGGAGNIVAIDEPPEYRGNEPTSSGFLDYFEQHPGMSILSYQAAPVNVDGAQQVIRDVITAYDNIDVIWCSGPGANIGAKQALEQMDKVGQIDLWCHGDFLDPQIYYMQNDINTGYMWVDNNLYSEYLVSLVLFLLRTGYYSETNTLDGTPHVKVPAILLTQENIWDYFPERVRMAIYENGEIVGWMD